MFDPTKGPGQITKKDCWISATIIAIFMSLGRFPGVKFEKDFVVVFPNNFRVKLISFSDSELENVIRASRVYFSKDCQLKQQHLTYKKLENFGSPDSISELLLGKKFEVYCTSNYSMSRIFYPRVNNSQLKKLLTSGDILLCTFNFCPSHLYVVLELIDDNILSVIDVSHSDIKICKVNIEEIYIIMRLKLF